MQCIVQWDNRLHGVVFFLMEIPELAMEAFAA